MTVLLAGCAEGEESSAPAVSGEESKAGSSVTEKDIRATNLLKGVTVRDVEFTAIERPYHPMMTDLALKLAQQAQKEAGNDNMLVSPLSVFYAMAMVSNGAVDKEAVNEFWGGVDMLHINEFMSEYQAGLPEGEKYKLSLANSVWFTEKHQFEVNRDFLQTVADYYKAQAYQAPFDEETCKDINEWVEWQTDGMIKDILDRIPEDAVMYLVNALAFEAEWMEKYDETQVREGIFTTADGEKQTVQMMHSEESQYLEDENATGFLKYYAGMKYGFVALLPKEGISVEEYLSTLTGEGLQNMLENRASNTVFAALPMFETDFDMNLRDALGQMGYPVDSSFDGLGFSPEGNVTLGRILHKTYITVGPQGTKAGAATVVETVLESSPMYEDPKYVTLDRPFVYLIVDTEHNAPIFVGTVSSIDK
jgi:serpin B